MRAISLRPMRIPQTPLLFVFFLLQAAVQIGVFWYALALLIESLQPLAVTRYVKMDPLLLFLVITGLLYHVLRTRLVKGVVGELSSSLRIGNAAVLLGVLVVGCLSIIVKIRMFEFNRILIPLCFLGIFLILAALPFLDHEKNAESD